MNTSKNCILTSGESPGVSWSMLNKYTAGNPSRLYISADFLIPSYKYLSMSSALVVPFFAHGTRSSDGLFLNEADN